MSLSKQIIADLSNVLLIFILTLKVNFQEVFFFKKAYFFCNINFLGYTDIVFHWLPKICLESFAMLMTLVKLTTFYRSSNLNPALGHGCSENLKSLLKIIYYLRRLTG